MQPLCAISGTYSQVGGVVWWYMESQHAFGGHKNHLKIDPDLDSGTLASISISNIGGALATMS